MLSLRNIAKSYRHRSILRDVSIDFQPDRITALVGENGVGKTTLLKIAVGLERQDRGEVHFNDQSMTKWPVHKRIKAGLGYMSQESSAITDLTVEDNLYLIPRVMEKQEKDEAWREDLLNRFNLNHIRKSKVKTLSGGELRKLEFCLCMALKPGLILLDEPFAGLDPKTIKIVTRMIYDMHSLNVGFLIVDHRIEELKSLAEYYILLNQQRIDFEGSKKQFFKDALVKKEFLG